jgi:hypothetical protein
VAGALEDDLFGKPKANGPRMILARGQTHWLTTGRWEIALARPRPLIHRRHPSARARSVPTSLSAKRDGPGSRGRRAKATHPGGVPSGYPMKSNDHQKGTCGPRRSLCRRFQSVFGLKAKHGRRCLWLDLQARAESLLRPGQTLERVSYFTARVRKDPDGERRQSDYLNALACHSPLVTSSTAVSRRSTAGVGNADPLGRCTRRRRRT